MTEVDRTEKALQAALKITDSGLLIATHLAILCILAAKFLDRLKTKEEENAKEDETTQPTE